MRRERWIVVLLIAGAVTIGAMAGCGGNKAKDKEDDDIMAGAPTTSAPAGDSAAAGGGAPGEVSMAVGEQVVQTNCVLCHGQSGKGDGPGGAALNPKPRDWTDHAYMGSRTDQQLYDVIFNGKGAMPAWGKQGTLNESQIKSAILKVRTFDPQYKKS